MMQKRSKRQHNLRLAAAGERQFTSTNSKRSRKVTSLPALRRAKMSAFVHETMPTFSVTVGAALMAQWGR